MTDNKGFQDVRTAAQLLASEKLPKSLSFAKKNPIPAKLRAIASKVTGLTSAASGTSIGKYALLGAAKIAAAVAGSKLLSAISGKAAASVSTIQKASSAVGIGVSIIEETDATKLVRPLIDGSSVNPAQLGKTLSKTAAKGILASLVTGVPLASGIPQVSLPFKSLVKLKASPRFFDSKKAAATTTSVLPTTISIVQQRGMLEDEIMYRLVLLAENVYAPIRRHSISLGFGAPTILEGFRSENSGCSQHERGEAIDITLASATNLYNLAIWIRDNVAYDQLVLCHSSIAGGQSWIHISLTPESRRREVWTKAFNDTFEAGLHLYAAYTNAAILAADKAVATMQSKLATDTVQRLAARDAKLNPIGVNTEEQTKDLPSSSTGTDGRVTPTGAPKAVYVGHPGGTCALPSMPDNDTYTVETPSYLEQVAEAQAEVYLSESQNTAVFNTDGTVADEVAYCSAVATVLRSYGFCAQAMVRVPDEISVKTTNDFSDQYDLVSGSTNLPILLYAATTRPALF